jgi:hypothetical protein
MGAVQVTGGGNGIGASKLSRMFSTCAGGAVQSNSLAVDLNRVANGHRSAATSANRILTTDRIIAGLWWLVGSITLWRIPAANSFN